MILMRSLLRVLLAATALVLVTACALLRHTGVDDEAKHAARVALTAYADIVQPAIITYGRLPTCDPRSAVALCKDAAAWAKIKAADAAATSSILAARSVLDGTAVDNGELARAIADVTAAQAAFKQTAKR
jgi:hypothetical protein